MDKVWSLIVLAILALMILSPAFTQTSDVATLSYRSFVQLAQVYKSGGSSPSLVDQMNDALTLIEMAHEKGRQGDVANATKFENQARTIMNVVSPEIAIAEQQAVQNSTSRTQSNFADAALVVGVLTLGFYAGLIGWRWYEKVSFFEMKIVEEDTKT